jgi:mannan endo-1,4-beta-mannosidase
VVSRHTYIPTGKRLRARLLAACSAGLLAACSGLDKTALHALPPRAQADREVGERMVGAYIYGGVWRGFEEVQALEEAIQHRFHINHWFGNWDNPWEDALVRGVLSRGSLPLITWQSHDRSFTEIAGGVHDAYLTSWARGVAALDADVYLRLFPEMNGDWVAWNGDPDGLKAAWRHIVTLFRREGADNARFVWSPNVTDQPRTPENRMEAYYPGHDYVDVLALDGYNWGTARPWSAWRSFEDIFSEPYARIAALGHQPIWLAEIASAEDGGDKGAWVRDMLTSRAFPRIQAVVWFDENKETDWRIGSSAESLAAFQEALVDSQLAAR